MACRRARQPPPERRAKCPGPAFEPRAVSVLGALGGGDSLHGRSIYGAGPSELVAPPDCRFTQV